MLGRAAPSDYVDLPPVHTEVLYTLAEQLDYEDIRLPSSAGHVGKDGAGVGRRPSLTLQRPSAAVGPLAKRRVSGKHAPAAPVYAYGAANVDDSDYSLATEEPLDSASITTPVSAIDLTDMRRPSFVEFARMPEPDFVDAYLQVAAVTGDEEDEETFSEWGARSATHVVILDVV